MALALLLAGGVAQAIINGEPDTGPKAHPYVGALVSVPPSGEFKGQRIPGCSGTLISPRVSGGPLFVLDQETIVGVTSAHIAPLCRGPAYYQRMDLPGVLSWVRSLP
jgi:hypothetical protein